MDAQKQRLRFSDLKTQASGWRDLWREIAENVRPRSLRFHPLDAGRAAQERNAEIINCEPTLASRTLAAGLHSGITSPSRPWFRLGLSDPTLEAQAGVKEYLSRSEDVVREHFAKSNIYGALAVLYADLVDFGTALMHVDEDEEDVLRAYVYPAGSYVFAQSPRLSVDTYFYSATMTVRQLVEMFGDACSLSVKNLNESGRVEERIEVTRCVMRNPKPGKGDPSKLVDADKPWLSYWWETNAPTDAVSQGTYLRVSGYNEKPFMGPRWETTGEDVYGHSPGMVALGDCKALQVLELQRAKMHAKLVDPPVVAPGHLQQRTVSMLPGGVTYLPTVTAADAIRPIHVVPPQGPTVAAADIREHENRIRKAYFADLWLMLSQSEGTMTAREVAERREEKLLQLGHVLEKLQDELLEPLIDRTIAILGRKGLLPELPEALKGETYRVEYISMMAQAQKTLGLTAIDRTAGFVAQLFATFPSAADMLDVDKTVQVYARATGVPPEMIRDEAAVKKLREERAKQQKAQAAMAQAPEAAKTMKAMGETDTSKVAEVGEMLRAVGVR